MAFKILGFSVILSSALMVFAVQKPGEVTWYDPREVGKKDGIGACGGAPLDKNMPIAALAKEYFDTYPGQTGNPNTNPLCGKKVKVTVNGNSVEVTIRDRCESCLGIFDIDISHKSLVELTGSPDTGRFKGTWDFVDPALDIGPKPNDVGTTGTANPPPGTKPEPKPRRSIPNNDDDSNIGITGPTPTQPSRVSYRPRRVSRVMRRLVDNDDGGIQVAAARGGGVVKSETQSVNPRSTYSSTPKRLSRVMRGVVLDEQD